MSGWNMESRLCSDCSRCAACAASIILPILDTSDAIIAPVPFRASLLLLLCLSARAAELQVQYAAIQRILAQEVFTQDGRRYVSGTPAEKCSFAYLEHPKLSGNNGKLILKAHFTGVSALDILGRCIGLGDSVDVYITALPYYHDNAIALKDVRAESLGYYIRWVWAALADSLRKQFEYRVAADAKRILEQKREQSPYRQELLNFDVPQIRAAPDSLIVTLDFTLVVK
jgi:hypothetical protein